MEGLKPPKTMRVYQLIKLNAANGLNFGVAGGIPAGSANYIGTGFYTTLQEAEHHRTLEILKDTSGSVTSFHIFELEFPNPAYRE